MVFAWGGGTDGGRVAPMPNYAAKSSDLKAAYAKGFGRVARREGAAPEVEVMNVARMLQILNVRQEEWACRCAVLKITDTTRSWATHGRSARAGGTRAAPPSRGASARTTR
jgi:hypothetical protein